MSIANQKEIRRYLTRSKELGVIPNFFMSEPYLELSKIRSQEREGWIWLQDKYWTLFPALPLHEAKFEPFPEDFPIQRIWALFSNDFVPINDHYHFLDWQYLFRPTDFLNMEGSRWEVFRKNSRKWSNRNPGWYYTETPPTSSDAGELIAEWLDRKRNDVHDGELLARFAFFEDGLPIFRKYLYNKSGELVGINAWDENWMFINYRVCIVREDPFLDEFIRLLFYTDEKVIGMNKIVNDGGTLGHEGLQRFKDKMNPFEKHKIYSWIK